MAVAAALAGLQAEANCPVCLDGLSDPVTIDCGHNFCRRCIQQSWAHLEDRFPCPVCRHPCQERHVRSNTQLGRMIDIARQLGGRRSKRRRREEPRLCERHHQVLGLFCEDDLELLCPLCTQPPEHQGHVVRSVGEAAAHHRKRLGSYVEPLKTRVADAQSLVAAQDRKLLELREQVQRQRRELALEFGQLNRAVDREQEAVLERLVQEERDIQEQLGANVAAFSDHISTLKGLLQEVAERSVLPGVRLLRGIGGVLRRCEGLRCPAVYSFQLRREGCSLPPQHSALRKIIQTFREDVSLDPETAHPSLLVSEDRKSATFLGRKRRAPRGARRLSAEPAVLGTQGFHCVDSYFNMTSSKEDTREVYASRKHCGQAQRGHVQDKEASGETRPAGALILDLQHHKLAATDIFPVTERTDLMTVNTETHGSLSKKGQNKERACSLP
nr:putative tripartite motif-containing protein 75 [Vicugna pacos]